MLIDESKRARGFSLIEMMIAVALGMIVVAGAITLIVAINQANSETIQSTRLTQELRTLASVIADDVKRTRRIDDPIGMIGQGSTNACATAPVTPAQPCYPITPNAVSGSPPSCITYGYTGTLSAPSLYNYHSIRLATSGGVGKVMFSQLTFDPNAVAKGTALPTQTVITHCDSAGGITGGTETQINSIQINITALTFTYVNPGEIDLSITGQFLSGDAYTKTLSRTFRQPVFIRSSAL